MKDKQNEIRFGSDGENSDQKPTPSGVKIVKTIKVVATILIVLGIVGLIFNVAAFTIGQYKQMQRTMLS